MEVLIYAVVGAFAGFLTGLGIGGGFVVAPVLIWWFTNHAVPKEIIIPLALGTSLATVIFSAASALLSHNRRSAVSWRLVAVMSPGLVAGSILGSTLTASLPSAHIKLVLAALFTFTATQLLLKIKPGHGETSPGPLRLLGFGTGVGTFGGAAGMGGSSLAVPLMVWWRIPMQVAIGTASGLSLVTAIAGTLGYVGYGFALQNLPPNSFSFVYLPALFTIGVTSWLCAPLGARAAHALPVPKLKLWFALMLYIVAVRIAMG